MPSEGKGRDIKSIQVDENHVMSCHVMSSELNTYQVK